MRYIPKPILVDAMQLTKQNYTEVIDWINGGPTLSVGEINVTFRTLGGEIGVHPGDWIIKGVKGEFYLCKPEIFEATYDPAPHLACE